MKRNSRLASHMLTPIVLMALGVLVFHRSDLKHPVDRGAAGSAGASAEQNPLRHTAARVRSFRAEGVGLFDAISSQGPKGEGLRPPRNFDSGAMVQPTSRDLFIDGHATELGAFQGILQAPIAFAGRRLAILIVQGDDGNVIRLILRSKTAAASDDWMGTYVVLGGTGQFERATGRGSYRYVPVVAQNWDTVTIALEGTICY